MAWRHRNRGYWDRDFFPKSRPRQAKGGIKAQSKRGQFGASWWAKRWIAVLESFEIGARLGRGRSYARNGQVLSIEVDKGKVAASVQGSRPTPYKVAIQVRQLDKSDWDKAVQALSGQALYLAKLLAGEMPEDVEKAFTAAGLSLFPSKLKDLETSCSCPDYSNPCKHIAAVYYLLGEEFDRDPFLIFQLRGLSREELLGRLHEAAPSGSTPGKSAAAEPAAGDPLPEDPKLFWSGSAIPADLFQDYQAPPVTAAMPKRLGSFPFWRGQERFLDALEPIYRRAGEAGLRMLVGDSSAGDSHD
jgi:uncharacterized Zn finger protein